MRSFGDERFLTAWIDSVNADSTFADVTRWFDGSILLSQAARECWLKIYAGRVIDRLAFMPPLGYTFKLSAPEWAWDELTSGRPFSDLLLAGKRRFDGSNDFGGEPGRTPGVFTLEGDLMSAHRVIAAVYVIADRYAAVSRALENAA